MKNFLDKKEESMKINLHNEYRRGYENGKFYMSCDLSNKISTDIISGVKYEDILKSLLKDFEIFTDDYINGLFCKYILYVDREYQISSNNKECLIKYVEDCKKADELYNRKRTYEIEEVVNE